MKKSTKWIFIVVALISVFLYFFDINYSLMATIVVAGLVSGLASETLKK